MTNKITFKFKKINEKKRKQKINLIKCKTQIE